MANKFFQAKQSFLPYERSLIAKNDVNGMQKSFTKVTPEIIKSGEEKDSVVTTAAARGTLIEIIPMHIKNPPRITFIAFLDAFVDNFRPDFNSVNVYGRPDRYHIWKASQRNLALTITVPSSGKNMALRNLANINWFLASLYPAYKEDSHGTNAVSASPLFRVKYANMIMSANHFEGLLCTITGVRVSHNKKAGFIPIVVDQHLGVDPAGPDPLRDLEGLVVAPTGRVNDQDRYDALIGEGTTRPSNFVIPAEYKLSFNLTAIHEHSLGWDHNTGDWRGPSNEGSNIARSFPYGIELDKDLPDPTKDKDAAAVNVNPVEDAVVDAPTERLCDVNPADGKLEGCLEENQAAIREQAVEEDRIFDLTGQGGQPEGFFEPSPLGLGVGNLTLGGEG